MAKCIDCGKEIHDVEYIRYGGMCMVCWDINDKKRKGGVRK